MTFKELKYEHLTDSALQTVVDVAATYKHNAKALGEEGHIEVQLGDSMYFTTFGELRDALGNRSERYHNMSQHYEAMEDNVHDMIHEQSPVYGYPVVMGKNGIEGTVESEPSGLIYQGSPPVGIIQYRGNPPQAYMIPHALEHLPTDKLFWSKTLDWKIETDADVHRRIKLEMELERILTMEPEHILTMGGPNMGPDPIVSSKPIVWPVHQNTPGLIHTAGDECTQTDSAKVQKSNQLNTLKDKVYKALVETMHTSYDNQEKRAIAMTTIIMNEN